MVCVPCRAGLLTVPAGPGCSMHPWAASRPRAVRAASLRLGSSARSPARPRHRPRAPQPGPSQPSGALHTSGIWCAVGWLGASSSSPARPRRRRIDCARNSSMAHSNIEFASLELQRFWGVSKSDHDRLRAKFGWRPCRRCPRALQPDPAPPGAASWPCDVPARQWGFCTTRRPLSACRRRVGASCRAIPPRLVVVRPWVGVVRCPKCRPPRRKTLKTGCRGRGGLRFGRSGIWRGVCARR